MVKGINQTSEINKKKEKKKNIKINCKTKFRFVKYYTNIKK